jgi:anti-anti-sigma factor
MTAVTSPLLSPTIHRYTRLDGMAIIDVDDVPFFDAFLSYASRDRALAEPLADRLMRDGFDVFVDWRFLRPGQHIQKVLLTALRKSRTVLACMTPSYFQSPWAGFELNWNFVESQLGPAGADPRLIPVLLAACDVPKEITALRRVDLTGAAESEYRALASVLSGPAAIGVDAHAVPAGARGRDLGDFIAHKLRHFFDFPEARVREFLTVYAELVQNAFDHVAPRPDQVAVTLRAERDRLSIEVADPGRGFDLAAVLRAARDATAKDPSLVGLRGLQLVARLCDWVSNELRGGRHVVTAAMSRDRTIRDAPGLADFLATLPDGARAARDESGPQFRRFVDPEGSYAYLGFDMARIDHHSVEACRAFCSESLDGQSFRRVILDCSRVDYVSSVGLRVIMLVARQVRAGGGKTAVVASPLVREILEISKFTMIVDVVRTPAEALDLPR